MHVFTAPDCSGTLQETDEATPLWVPVDAIPYDEMWATTAYGCHGCSPARVELCAVFDGDAMLDHSLTT